MLHPMLFPCAHAAGQVPYIVQKGDTCSGVAMWYMVDVGKFKALNMVSGPGF